MRRLVVFVVMLGCNRDRALPFDAPDLARPPDLAMPPRSNDYTVGGQATKIIVADFNRDGLLDLAVNDFDAPAATSVAVLLGRGDGTFAGPTFYAGGPGAIDIAASIRPMGFVDLFVADEGGESPSNDAAYRWFGGMGDGTFSLVESQSFGDPMFEGIAVGDSGPQVTLLLSDSANSRGFLVAAGEPFGIPLPFQPGAVTVADLDGDGKLDAVVLEGGRNRIAVLLGDGTVKFQASFPKPLVDGAQCRQLFLADLDGDHLLDLALTCQAAVPGVAILRGDGNGGFTQTSVVTVAGEQPYAANVVDYDGDGTPDVIFAADETITVHRGNGDGTFGGGPSIAGLRTPTFVAAGDFDRDGHMDLVETGFADDFKTRVLRVLLAR